MCEWMLEIETKEQKMSAIVFEREDQCDQIRRYFAPLVNYKNLWQNIKHLFSIWRNFEPTMAIFYMILGKYSLL